jgi:hypothetical protein
MRTTGANIPYPWSVSLVRCRTEPRATPSRPVLEKRHNRPEVAIYSGGPGEEELQQGRLQIDSP